MTTMARGIAAIIAFVVMVLVLARLESPIAADTPISVVAADEVVLTLPVSPSVDRITSDLRQQLETMASTQTDPRLRTALQRFARDPELLLQAVSYTHLRAHETKTRISVSVMCV